MVGVLIVGAVILSVGSVEAQVGGGICYQGTSRDLSLGLSGSDVLNLQQVLNRDTRTLVATTGAGSPGQETTYFGTATELAVKKFQTLYGISTIGVVGTQTRSKLTQLYGCSSGGGSAAGTTAPTVSIYAGGGIGDGGSATSAVLFPEGVLTALGPNNTTDLYIVDKTQNRIRKYTGSTGLIETIAGTGVAGYQGDNGSAKNAQLNSPRDIARDTQGNLYIADTGNNVIRKIDSNGIITTFIGSLSVPSGIELDSNGSLYIADQGSNRVRKVTNGVITTIAGNGNWGFSGDNAAAINAKLASPSDIAIGADGTVYVADFQNNRIRKIDAAGIISTIAGTFGTGGAGNNGPAISAELYFPYRLAFQGSTLFITEAGGKKVRYITSDGTIRTLLTTPTIHTPNGIATDSNYIYVGDVEDAAKQAPGNRVIRLSIANPSPITVAGGGIGDGNIATQATVVPHTLSLGSNGLYINELPNRRIRYVDENSKKIISLGNLGSENINDIAVHPDGSVYFTQNNTVRRIDPGNDGVVNGGSDERITTVAGNGNPGFSGDGGPATSAAFSTPWGLAFGPDGSLYIADSSNHRIRRVLNGIITTVAGTGSFGFSGDGGPATSARLGNPTDVVVGNDGSVYIVDFLNNRIRKVTSNGIITTIAGTGASAGTGDGGPATGAALSRPLQIDIDDNQNLYIADSLNKRVRLIDHATGNIYSLQGLPNTPTGIAASGDGKKVYVSSESDGLVRLIEQNGSAPSVPTPTVNLTFNDSDNPAPVPLTSLSTIKWVTTNNPTSCTGTGPSWTSSKNALAGADFLTMNTAGVFTYAITCDSYGGSASDSVTVAVGAFPPPSPAPVIALKINNQDGPLSINRNATATLSWTTQNFPIRCDASNSWSGPKSSNQGSEIISLNTIGLHTFTLTCANVGGTVSDSVTVAVGTPLPPTLPPTVELKINGQDTFTANQNATATLSWTTQNSPTSCTASNSWGGSKNSGGGSESISLTTIGTVTYTITCSNAGGSNSDSVTVTVQTPPPTPAPTVDLKLNGQDAPLTVNQYTGATLSWTTRNTPTSCTASNNWNGSKNSGGGSESVFLNNVGTFTFTLTCSNTGGSGLDSVTVTVQTPPPGPVPPSITTHPISATVATNQTVTFSVVAIGSQPLSYQWQHENGTAWNDIPGATQSRYSFSAVASDRFRVVVRNVAGSVNSNIATLTVSVPPRITVQPLTQTVSEGTPITFSVTATGTLPLSYEWRKNGVPIPGATNSTYSLTAALNDSGSDFAVIISNSAGSVTSYPPTRLTVTSRVVAPTVDLKINNQNGPLTVTQNTVGTLSWSTGNSPTSCTATGPRTWSGARSTTGSSEGFTFTDVGTFTFTLTCSNASGSGSDSVTVTVNAPLPPTLPPTVDVKINNGDTSPTVSQNTQVTLSWIIGNKPDSCTASGNWSGAKSTSTTPGQQTIILSAIQSYVFTLACQNSAGTTRDTVTATVAPRPTVTIQGNTSVLEATRETLSANVIGTAPYTYQWYKNGVLLSGQTGSSLVIPQATSNDAGTYTVRISDAYYRDIVSPGLALTVRSRPAAITQNPVDQSVMLGSSATFSVVATGTTPLSYQWLRNGVAISGATGSSYTIRATSADNNAQFSVRVWNSANSTGVTSNIATLRVSQLPPNNPPVATLSATTPVFWGDRVTLTWSTRDVSSCVTTAGTWTAPSGSNLGAGTFTTSPMFAVNTYPFAMQCQGPGGVTNASTSVVVLPNVFLTANDKASLDLLPGQSFTLRWQVKPGATSCVASGNWSGNKNVQGGTEIITPGSVNNYSYTLSCNGSWGSAGHGISVRVLNSLSTLRQTQTAQIMQTLETIAAQLKQLLGQ